MRERQREKDRKRKRETERERECVSNLIVPPLIMIHGFAEQQPVFHNFTHFMRTHTTLVSVVIKSGTVKPLSKTAKTPSDL